MLGVHLHLITAEDPLTLDARSHEQIRFPQLTMPLLAALTPTPWPVTHTDEITQPVDDARVTPGFESRKTGRVRTLFAKMRHL